MTAATTQSAEDLASENARRLEGLLAGVPAAWRPVARQYGPVLLKMTAEELWAWIGLMAAGDVDAAYRTLVAGMDNADLLAEFDVRIAAVRKIVGDAAERLKVVSQAEMAILQVALSMALALVGL